MNIRIPADFDLNELRAFIEGEAQEVPEGYYTAREWADHFQLSKRHARALLKEAKERGLLQMAWSQGETLDGRKHRVPVYALQSKEET